MSIDISNVPFVFGALGTNSRNLSTSQDAFGMPNIIKNEQMAALLGAQLMCRGKCSVSKLRARAEMCSSSPGRKYLRAGEDIKSNLIIIIIGNAYVAALIGARLMYRRK